MKILVALLLLTCPAFAQLEHLKPVEEHYTDIVNARDHFRYHDLVFERLFAGQPKATAYLLEIGSFTPERLLLLCDVDGEFYAILRRPKVQIWSHSVKPDSSVILTTKTKIDRALAKRIVELWHRELHLTRYPERDQGAALDGVHYYVGGTFLHPSARGYFSEVMIGDIANPGEESCIGSMIAVGNMLIRYLEFPDALRLCVTPSERIQWIDHVIADNEKIEWMIVLDGPSAYMRDPFLRDPWTEIMKQISKAEGKEANQALLPTTTAVTDPAVQAPRQP